MSIGNVPLNLKEYTMELNRRQCLATLGTLFFFCLHLQECVSIIVLRYELCLVDENAWYKCTCNNCELINKVISSLDLEMQ